MFTGRCAASGHTALPALPATVAAFADAMAAVRALATVRRYLSNVSRHEPAALLGQPLRRRRRPLGDEAPAPGARPGAGAGASRERVKRMLAASGGGPCGLRNGALLAVAYDNLCRRAELVALEYRDLEAGPHGDGLLVLRRSKTNAEGRGSVRYLAADTARVLRAWSDAAGHTDSVLFRAVGKGGTVGGPLDPGDVARVFKQMAAAAGDAPEAVAAASGHSSRVGAAQDQVRLGVQLQAVMQAGGWTTPTMVARYTAGLDARRSGAAKVATLRNRN